MSTDESQNALKSQIAELKAELVRAVLFEMKREGRLDLDSALVSEISMHLDAAVSRSLKEGLNTESGPLAELNRKISGYSSDWATLLGNVGQGLGETSTRLGDLQRQAEELSTSGASRHVEAIERALGQIEARVAKLNHSFAALEARTVDGRREHLPGPATTLAPLLSSKPSSPEAGLDAPAPVEPEDTAAPPGPAVPAGHSRFKVRLLRWRGWLRSGRNRLFAGGILIFVAVAAYFLGPQLWRVAMDRGDDANEFCLDAPAAPADLGPCGTAKVRGVARGSPGIHRGGRRHAE